MMRRHSSGATAAAGLAPAVPCAASRTFSFKNPFKKSQPGDASSQQQQSSSPGGFPGAPPNVDFKTMMQMAQKLQQLRSIDPNNKTASNNLFLDMSMKQMNEMRKLIEMQKSMAQGMPGLGSVTQKQAEMADAVMARIDEEMKRRGVDTTKFDSPANREKKAEEISKSGATATTTTTAAGSASSPSSSSASSPSSGVRNINGQEVDLGPEIEALFAELRTLRDKRNFHRAESDKKDAELVKIRAELAAARDRADRLSDKLGHAERDVMLLNSESLELKETVKKAKALQKENAELKVRVSALGGADTVAQAKQVESLQAAVAERDALLRSLNRKLDRARKRSPLLQFSLALSELKRLAATSNLQRSATHHHQHGSSNGSNDDSATSSGGGASGGGSSVGAHGAGAARAVQLQNSDENFATLQEAYETAVWDEWATRAPPLGASVALATAAKEFVAASLANSRLDAIVTIASSGGGVSQQQAVSAAKKLLIEHGGFEIVTVDGAEPGTFQVLAPENAPLRDHIGPFGFCKALKETINGTGGSSSSSGSDLGTFTVTACHPFLSQRLAKNTTRTSVAISTSRSSKPGGQASNVAETQVTLRLFVDGELRIVSEAQDSRSTMSNQQSATERLYAERLDHFNKQLRHGGDASISGGTSGLFGGSESGTGASLGGSGGDEAASVGVIAAQWETLCAPCVRAMPNPLDQHVVEWVRRIAMAAGTHP